MKIKLSRHAQRRLTLYTISESTIKQLLSNLDFQDGEHEMIRKVAGFKYPLKVIFAVEENAITVITSYPMKKRRKQ